MHGMPIRGAYYCIFRAANAPDLGLKAHLPIEHEKKFVAPAHNSERRIGYLGGQFAIIKPFALTIHHRPSFKGSFAGVDPFDSVAARIVEQHRKVGITRSQATTARLRQRGSYFRNRGFCNKMIPSEFLFGAHTRARAIHTSHPQLSIFDLERAASATFEGETLPFSGIERTSLKGSIPLLHRWIRLRKCPHE